MDDCIFCQIAKGLIPSAKVYEDEKTYAFFDINPVNAYHTLVIPKSHYESIFDIPTSELQHIVNSVKTITTLFRNKLKMGNVQIINSSGNEAQQDVPHIHFHIVPRHLGDGQDITWSPHPELVEEFDKLLEKLKSET